jgi:hypothetical protein
VQTRLARVRAGSARAQTGSARAQTGLARVQTGLARVQTGLARARTRLARARTRLARARTGIARQLTGVAAQPRLRIGNGVVPGGLGGGAGSTTDTVGLAPGIVPRKRSGSSTICCATFSDPAQ